MINYKLEMLYKNAILSILIAIMTTLMKSDRQYRFQEQAFQAMIGWQNECAKEVGLTFPE